MPKSKQKQVVATLKALAEYRIQHDLSWPELAAQINASVGSRPTEWRTFYMAVRLNAVGDRNLHKIETFLRGVTVDA